MQRTKSHSHGTKRPSREDRTVLENVKTGTFVAEIIRSSKQSVNLELLIWHQAWLGSDVLRRYALRGTEGLKDWTKLTDPKFVIGVDSGQAGFFNDANYPDTPNDNRKSFYDVCCYITGETRLCAGIIGASSTKGIGVVSRCGHSDGGDEGAYDLHVIYDAQKQVVAARLIFLTAQDLDDENELEEDDEVREPVCAVYCGTNLPDEELNDDDNDDDDDDEK